MARVTVEDCVLRVPNRFELVMLAARRGREITSGAQLTVERDRDKNPVVALREIADDTVDLEQLRDGLVKDLQKHVEADQPEEDQIDLQAGENVLGAMSEELQKPAAETAGEDDDIALEAGDDIDLPEEPEASEASETKEKEAS